MLFMIYGLDVSKVVFVFLQSGERNSRSLSWSSFEGEQRWVEGKFQILCAMLWEDK